MGSILREMGGDPTREQKEFEVECDGCGAPVLDREHRQHPVEHDRVRDVTGRKDVAAGEDVVGVPVVLRPDAAGDFLHHADREVQREQGRYEQDDRAR